MSRIRKHQIFLKIFFFAITQALLACTIIQRAISPCEKLLDSADVTKWLQDNSELVMEIEAVHPGVVGVTMEEVDYCPGKRQILILYPKESDVPKIKKIIGNRLNGIPYRMQNI